MKRRAVLKNSTCYLAPLSRADLPALKRWRNEQMDVLRQTKMLTDKDQVRWFQTLKRDNQQLIFALCDKQTDQLIGYCGLTHIDWANGRAEISFLLETDLGSTPTNPRYRALLLETLNLLKKYAFGKLHLHKLFTETFAFRIAHLAIIEVFGFKYDGKLTDHIWHKGRYVSSQLHYILNQEKGPPPVTARH